MDGWWPITSGPSGREPSAYASTITSRYWRRSPARWLVPPPCRPHGRQGSFGNVHERFWKAARRKLGDAAGTRALIEVLLAHRHTEHEVLVAGMEAALVAGSVDPAVVLVEARRSAENASTVPVPIGSLHLFDRPMPVLSPYDELLEASS